jgi:outer membrane cobalamin receptor
MKKQYLQGRPYINIPIFLFIFLLSFILHSPALSDSLSYISVPPPDLPYYPALTTPTKKQDQSVLIPARVLVVTKEEIFETGAKDLGEVFTSLPGTHVGRYRYIGKSQTLFLRGSGSEQVLFLLDGIPLNDNELGGLDLNQIPINWVERIEILLEGASSLYGRDAVGGVVNIITKSLVDSRGGFKTRPYSRIGMRRGSFDTSLVEFEFGRKFGKNRLYLTGDILDSEGFLADKYRRRAGSGRWVVDSLKGWKIALSGRHLEADQGGSSSDSLEESRTLLSLHMGREESDMLVSFRYDKEEDGMRRNENSVLNVESVTRLSSILFGIQGSGRWGMNEETVEGGIFFSLDKEIFPLFRLMPSLRGDANSVYGTDISPKLSLGYTPSLDFHLFASASQSYRAPTFNELFSATGDTTLKPERVLSASAGAEYLNPVWKIGFSLFRNETVKTLGSYPEIRTHGLEGEIEYKFKIKSSKFKMRGHGTFLQAEDQISGDDLPYRPEFQGGWSVQYEKKLIKGNLGLKVSLEGEYVGERVSETNENLSDFHLLHSRGELSIVDFQLFAKVKNLSDEDYVSRFNFELPGRTFQAGVVWAFWD